jgi:acyl-CoA thioester hydrolase
MYSFDFKKRVRYAETDQMGYLYYGNYATYYEIGRVELIRSIGLSYKQMEEDWKVMMPVASMEVKFLRPIYYDEEITIRTTIKELPEKFVNFHCELINEAGKLVNVAKVRLCFVDMNTMKTCPLAPAPLIQKLQEIFEQ